MAPTIRERERPRDLKRIPETAQIKALLAANSMSQAELARALKINRHHLCAVLNRKQLIGPNSPLARRISEYLNMPVDALFPVVDLNEVDRIAAA